MLHLSPRIAAGALVLTLTVAGTGLRLAAASGLLGETAAETRAAALPLAGKLVVAGAATINGKKALSGTTIFSENRIAVAAAFGNVATITLDGLGRVDLQPGTELVLRFAEGFIGGKLLAGQAVIHNLAGVKVALQTPTGLATADGQEAIATVASTQLEKVLTPQEMATEAAKLVQLGQEAATTTQRLLEQTKDEAKKRCLKDKQDQLNAAVKSMQEHQEALQAAVKENNKNRAQDEFGALKVLQTQIAKLLEEARRCPGALLVNGKAGGSGGGGNAIGGGSLAGLGAAAAVAATAIVSANHDTGGPQYTCVPLP